RLLRLPVTSRQLSPSRRVLPPPLSVPSVALRLSTASPPSRLSRPSRRVRPVHRIASIPSRLAPSRLARRVRPACPSRSATPRPSRPTYRAVPRRARPVLPAAQLRAARVPSSRAPVLSLHTALPILPCCALPCGSAGFGSSSSHLFASAMATPMVLRFDAEGRPLEFSVWLLRARRLLESQVQADESLRAHVSGDLPKPNDPAPLGADPSSADRDRYARQHAELTAWKSRDAAACIALSSLLPESEEAHFTQVRTASEFLTAFKACYATPTTVSLGRLFLPYHAACTDAQLALLPPPMAITIYFIATSLPDCLASVREALLLKHPTELSIEVLESALKDVESNLRSVAFASGAVPPPLFHGCIVPQLPTFTASLATAAADVTATAVTTSSSLGVGVAGGAVRVRAEAAEVAWRVVVEGVQSVLRLIRSTPAPSLLRFEVSEGTCVDTILGAAPEDTSLSFTLDSGASHCFFRDHTTLTPLPATVSVALADLTSGPVTARYTTTLPCPAVPFGFLMGFHVPSFSRNLVGVRPLVSSHVGVWIEPSGETVVCVDGDTAAAAAAVATAPRQVAPSHQIAVSHQVAVSGQVPVSGPVAVSCTCWSLAHPTVLWHHRLGHPSIPRLRAMSSQRLVLGLPQFLQSLPPSLAPPCGPCVEGRLRATPHSSSLRPATQPFETLHLDV
ncbi:unnamed protein product, partial [Closterium sp. NIES-53]